MIVFFTLAMDNGVNIVPIGVQYDDLPSAKAAADLFAARYLQAVYVMQVIGAQSPRLPVLTDWSTA